ncbi:MAG TPA: peptidase S8, partial [Bacteroidia bacterium]|nr:peptidase S8 [Bacteroidia bacterium]
MTLSPNNSLLNKQWALHNTGQSGGIAGEDIKAVEAWALNMGRPEIFIAIIDDGVDSLPEEFHNKLVHAYDAITNTNSGQPRKEDSHGT